MMDSSSKSSIVFAGIAPHPPIMVPEVGREAIADVQGSINAMREFTNRLVASGAETVVLISPHAPLEPRAFIAYQDAHLRGDFANFRAPGATVEASLDEELLDAITNEAAGQNYEVAAISGYKLDHGTAVPLYFLQRNGWRGSLVALGYNFLSNEDHLRFGSCIKRAADAISRRVAVIASGDLSHRLTPDAPAGYNLEAHLFDEEIVASIRACAPSRIVNINQRLRRLAGECGYRSMLVAIGATEGLFLDCQVLHYEAPFGVGYLVAQVRSVPAINQNESAQDEQARELNLEPANESFKQLPALARRAVETFTLEDRIIEAPTGIFKEPSACFVSIKTLDGDLRGCIGTIEPAQETLGEELIASAISAATRDPRFPPIAPDELPHLRYSVDVLYPPEPAAFEELDPAVYGVIVEDADGARRGLLLPDIAGVDTADQQVNIAARKAGIAPGAALKLFRFRVERFREHNALQ